MTSSRVRPTRLTVLKTRAAASIASIVEACASGGRPDAFRSPDISAVCHISFKSVARLLGRVTAGAGAGAGAAAGAAAAAVAAAVAGLLLLTSSHAELTSAAPLRPTSAVHR